MPHRGSVGVSLVERWDGLAADLPNPLAVADLFDQALYRISLGGLTGLLNRLREAGFSDLVAAWTILGERRPISAANLRSALGEGYIRQFAKSAHVAEESALAIIAYALPDRAIASSARL